MCCYCVPCFYYYDCKEFKVFYPDKQVKNWCLHLSPQAVWIRSVIIPPTARIPTVFQSHWTSLLSPVSWFRGFRFAYRQKKHKYVGLCSNCQKEKNDTTWCLDVGRHSSEKPRNEKHPQLFMTKKYQSYRFGIEYRRDCCFSSRHAERDLCQKKKERIIQKSKFRLPPNV